ncbi:glutathione synthase [Agrobacterium salinitolerans]|uniref:Glutathione synthetase n=1 Tax=Agrobacterium salinitolerans TaxID=1183413 RepID=A0A9X3KNM0_9HYPH|nr:MULTISPECIES: glutathione synthase [Agrobacterium]PNQ20937.1 glutathione synthase [Rhizobium sp. YIC5082]MCZ7854780.1 glutathione synthase [Agrobacterium salinitolerans]MCZ7893533.1 glutathione synthase [Agrobacterium salinitolerans]MCZ7938171.1 glutathione synthase [Agrobacterium salinitolerans]MCZ7973340.1 glutathione synthase [Agrobacterium salinitolerans]
MRIAFFVNSIETEGPTFATGLLAMAALNRGHDVVYLTPGDFTLRSDDTLAVHATVVRKGKYKKPEAFHAALQDKALERMTMDVEEIDALMLRNDPSLDQTTRPWAVHAGILFGRLAEQRGVVVLNDPEGLALAQNKLYFQSFPEIVRPTTLISRNVEEIRAFADAHPKGVIVKPLQGSGGKNVFKIGSSKETNLNQIFEAVSLEGYLIAQAYLPAAKEGDVRFFMMNGRPLMRDGQYAALRRVPAKGDLRSNIHANGTAEAVKVTDEIVELAEMMRPKLVEDGMFLVGLDIVGDKILEVNVFSPGGLSNILELTNVDFSDTIIEAVETKVSMQAASGGALSNRLLATL